MPFCICHTSTRHRNVRHLRIHWSLDVVLTFHPSTHATRLLLGLQLLHRDYRRISCYRHFASARLPWSERMAIPLFDRGLLDLGRGVDFVLSDAGKSDADQDMAQATRLVLRTVSDS